MQRNLYLYSDLYQCEHGVMSSKWQVCITCCNVHAADWH